MAFNAHSSEWLAVKRYADDALERAINEIKRDGTDHGATQFKRGQIAALEALIMQGKNGFPEPKK